MSAAYYVKRTAAAAAATLMIAGAMTLVSSAGRADNDRGDGNSDPEKILIGLRIAPVPLNMTHKDRNLVGMGSYLVNAVADCNGCHTADPSTEYTATGNPYLFAPPSQTMHMPKQVNPATYLGGGQDFGAYPSPDSPLHIYTRNLTPDITGKPEGGHSFSDFLVIMRTGKDFDHIHPTCPAGTAQTATCVPYPFDGDLLQIMPWPAFKDMTTGDLRAMYEYLSAIPCIDTVVTGQPQLRNNCPK
ncbi:MAG TPA: hypothetical protein VHC90_14180 [Bryobacteraceae bacterium]|nr:hypothetical protein [Bryobacteraceae bacterium]